MKCETQEDPGESPLVCRWSVEGVKDALLDSNLTLQNNVKGKKKKEEDVGYNNKETQDRGRKNDMTTTMSRFVFFFPSLGSPYHYV